MSGVDRRPPRLNRHSDFNRHCEEPRDEATQPAALDGVAALAITVQPLGCELINGRFRHEGLTTDQGRQPTFAFTVAPCLTRGLAFFSRRDVGSNGSAWLGNKISLAPCQARGDEGETDFTGGSRQAVLMSLRPNPYRVAASAVGR